jgi:hypothetical protein
VAHDDRLFCGEPRALPQPAERDRLPVAGRIRRLRSTQPCAAQIVVARRDGDAPQPRDKRSIVTAPVPVEIQKRFSEGVLNNSLDVLVPWKETACQSRYEAVMAVEQLGERRFVPGANGLNDSADNLDIPYI